jgi:hypothetical protein
MHDRLRKVVVLLVQVFIIHFKNISNISPFRKSDCQKVLIRLFVASRITPSQISTSPVIPPQKFPTFNGPRLSPSTLEVLSFLELLQANYSVGFESDFIAELMKSLRPGLVALDVRAFSIFGTFSVRLSDQTLETCMSEIASNLIQLIEEKAKLFIEIPKIELPPLKPTVSSVFKLAFPHVIDFDAAVNLPDNIDLTELVPKELLAILHALRGFFESSSSCLLFLPLSFLQKLK